MPATRIIIDMQAAFIAANRPNVVIGVTREIIAAMRERAPIILVEYRGSGKTHKGFLDLLKGYDKFAKIGKNTDGGSKEVLAAIVRRNFPYKYLRIGGVNTNACVQATVRGLVHSTLLRKSRIELVKAACGDGNERYDWRKFPVVGSNFKLV
jgi:nicotinamidase-related amidase